MGLCAVCLLNGGQSEVLEGLRVRLCLSVAKQLHMFKMSGKEWEDWKKVAGIKEVGRGRLTGNGRQGGS